MLANVSFRWLHSFREFHGDKELPYPTDPALFASTHVYGYDFSLIYQATERFSVSLELPLNDGDRTSYYEHDFVHKFTTRASGVGDLRIIGNYWLLEPEKHHEGNVSVGLGIKIPTGKDDAMDIFHQPAGPVLRPVDPAIQPGDGGVGIVTELSAFQKIYTNAFAYAQGIYLVNPRDSNGIQQPTGNEDFYTLGEFGYTFNSVPDQYLARAGAGYIVWSKYALALTVGGRVEGVPAKDLIGDNHGWRSAGYAFYLEPGLTVSKGRFSFSVTGPVALKRHADKNLTDIKVSNQFHADIGGNAAFADYLVTTSLSVAF
ncbi:MAG TPA: hypothetical protein VLK27_03015 [Chthoniobacterales bacterium]|nr:hypothetical protein [Chthoniobacterales bacterium]